MFKRNPKEFLRRFVIVDETWIYHYIPEMKEQLKQWISFGEQRRQKSAGKVTIIVFWDSRYHVHRLFEEEKNNHGAIQCWFIRSIRCSIDKRDGLIWRRKKCFFTTTPADSSAIATAKLVELRYELLPQSPYSLDLAPYDFFLFLIIFLNMKKWLGGNCFTSNKEVIAVTEAYFAEFDKSYFLNGLEKWEYCWTKCIELKRHYVEE